ncbi:acyl-CoA dehydrogenase family protein [Ancrocorticia sp.]|uniref:acyl-CoA dehydrogenase family protein n=1 Tax=Ancrocorticia sp. TaxID=2593684 RepID=UPI003F93B13F
MSMSTAPSTLLAKARGFVHEDVIPTEPHYREQLDRHPSDSEPDYWRRPPAVFDLMQRAEELGLSRLFLKEPWGQGLSNAEYAPIAEATGWSPHLAPAAMNCAAPDSGNMDLLAEFGTEEQQQRWLKPLVEGTIRSAFCMTEPNIASSDARNVETSITSNGETMKITGRKWFISGGLNPETELLIVMGRSDPNADPHRQQSMLIVPRDTPGVTVNRPMNVLGFDDREHGGHAEIIFEDVEVPNENVIHGLGEGFTIAQARLGPGRVHHCMRLIGMGERALQLALERAWDRAAFGSTLAEKDTVRHMVASARIALDQSRLLVLDTATTMDSFGNRAAHQRIQAIKIAVPCAVQKILDDVIQLFGAAGLSQDTPLAALFAAARGLRLADGPDETHLTSLGRSLLNRYRPE